MTVTEEALSTLEDEDQAHSVVAYALLRDLLGDDTEWVRKLSISH